MSKIKDICGSCWAFSATAVIQSWALSNDNQWDLSQQQLVDCTHNYGNYGCDGGWPTNALNYVRDSGLQTQDQYPYVARDQYCLAYGGDYKIKTILSAYGCNAISNAINSRPLSITVDATLWSSYAGGVFGNCGSSINHAVLLVGMDEQGTGRQKTRGVNHGASKDILDWQVEIHVVFAIIQASMLNDFHKDSFQDILILFIFQFQKQYQTINFIRIRIYILKKYSLINSYVYYDRVLIDKIYIMIIKKSILLIAIFLTLCSVFTAQQGENTKNPLILITQENHNAVTSIIDMNSMSKTLQNLKALTIEAQSIEQFAKQLKTIIKGLQIKKQQISSLVVDNADIQKLENINFSDIQSLKQIKQELQKQGNNILIQIKPAKKQTRLLQQEHDQQLITPPPIQANVGNSQLFINMTPSTLTGLLVTLFLLVVLLIAINCLYQVKTNDQFGRNNLWVGKQS